MIGKTKAFMAWAVIVVLAAGGLAALAVTAGAVTVGCQALTSGNGRCGSVAMQFGHLALDDWQQAEYPGNKIVLWTRSNADPAQDWYAAHYNTAGGAVHDRVRQERDPVRPVCHVPEDGSRHPRRTGALR